MISTEVQNCYQTREEISPIRMKWELVKDGGEGKHISSNASTQVS